VVNFGREVSRRAFMMTAGAIVVGCASSRQQGKSSMSKTNTYKDERTGAVLRRLVSGQGNNQVVYQTHPMWGLQMRHLLFVSDRTVGKPLPHVLEVSSGQIWCATPTGADDWTLSRKDNTLYFRRGSTLFSKDISSRDCEENLVAELSDWAGLHPISMSLDADEKSLYTGVVVEPDRRWGIVYLDLLAPKLEVFVEVDFKVGHVQANPVRPGLVMFCHETGGDAPQRMWVVNRNGSGLKPFYKETYDEWVTHEVWWGADRAIFTVWPYDEVHRNLPHGVVSADLETGTPKVHGQFPAWHTHGSPDGRWAVADDFDGNLWLICIQDGERRLLSQGHRKPGFDTHLHPSFTPDSKAVVFNSSYWGSNDILLVELPDWQTLPAA